MGGRVTGHHHVVLVKSLHLPRTVVRGNIVPGSVAEELLHRVLYSIVRSWASVALVDLSTMATWAPP